METRAITSHESLYGESSDLAGQVRACLVRRLYGASGFRLSAAFIGSMLAVAVLWRATPATILAGWFVAYLAVQGARQVLVAAFHQIAPSDQELPVWRYRFIFGTMLSALAIGVGSILVFPHGSMPHEFLLAVLMIGGASLVAHEYASDFSCGVTAVICMLGPYIGLYFSRGTEFDFTMGALLTFFGLMLIVFCRKTYFAMVTATTLQFRQDRLLSDMAAEKQRVEELCADLETEIQERRKTGEALLLSEQRHRAMVAGQSELIWKFGPDGIISFANEAFCKYFHMHEDEVAGAPFEPFLCAEDAPLLLEVIGHTSPAHPTRSVELKVQIVHGEIRWLALNVSGIYDGAGRLEEYQAVARDITDRQRAELALQASEAKLRSLLETARDVIWTLNLDLQYTYVSPAVTDILGYSVEEIMMKNPMDTLTPQSRERVVKVFTEQMKQEQENPTSVRTTWTEEIEQYRRDGSIACVEIRSAFLRDTCGQVVGIFGISRDMTDRKRMEQRLRQSEQRYRILVEESFDGVLIAQAGTVVFANFRLHELLGYDEGGLVGRGLDPLFIGRPEILGFVERGGESWSIKHVPATEVTLVRTDGMPAECEAAAKVVPFEGSMAVHIRFREIGERKLAERRLRLLSQAVEQSGDGIAVADLAGNLLFANHAWATMHGWRQEDLRGKHLSQFPVGGETARLEEASHELLRDGSFEGEVLHQRQDGRVFHVLRQDTLLRDEKGNPAGIIATAKNITNFKEVRQALEREKEKFRALSDSSPDAIVVYDTSGLVTYVNPAFVSLFGWREEDVMGSEIDYVPEWEATDKTNIFQTLNLGDGPVAFEAQRLTKSGELLDVHITSAFVRDNKAQLVGHIVVLRDITEFKRKREELRHSEERYRTLVETMNDGLGVCDPKGRFTFVNPQFCSMLGLPEEEILGRRAIDLVDENSSEKLLAQYRDRQQGVQAASYELVFQRSDGSLLPTLVSARGLYNGGHQFCGSFAVVTDITERKAMEAALAASKDELERKVVERTAELEQLNQQLQREVEHRRDVEASARRSEQRYRELVELMPQFVSEFDDNGRFTYVNEAGLNVLGYDRAHIQAGLYLKDIITAPSWTEIEADLKSLLNGQPLEGKEYVLSRRDGTALPVLAYLTRVVTVEGELRIRAVAFDFSRRKQVEESLRASEARFRSVFEKLTDCVFMKDRQLRYTYANPSMLDLLERDLSDLAGITDEDLFDKVAAKLLEGEDRRALEGQVIESEHTLNIQGRRVTFNSVKAPLFDTEGTCVGLCGIARDVSERRATEAGSPSNLPLHRSRALTAALKQAELAARSDSLILLLGESGSGKDFLARQIHGISHRAGGPFFSINCAALAPELAESELFGHEAGAFTGARGKKRGMMELAEGGTLLLNEIGELPLKLQAKLLTFLDTQSFTRVGGEKEIWVSARLLAATNRNLNEEVESGRFRADLFHRLNVFTIEVPPLRKRPEDLPALVEALLNRLSRKLGLTEAATMDSRCLDMLTEYNWPGNVRELRNVLERALILAQGSKIRRECIQLPLSGEPLDSDNEWSFQVKFPHRNENLPEITNRVKSALLSEALRRADGKKKKAAQLLGISADSFKHHAKSVGL